MAGESEVAEEEAAEEGIEARGRLSSEEEEDQGLADLREYAGSGRAREETDPYARLYIAQDDADIDAYGLFDILDFDSVGGAIASRLQYINTGSVGLVREYFYDAYDNKVIRYYTTASSDAGPSKDPPSIDSDGDVTYSSTETAALKSRFGADIGTTANDIYAYLENLMSKMTAEIVNTTIRPQFTFKKIKPPMFNDDVLSVFEETEEAQTVTTGVAVTEEVSATSYAESSE